MKHIAILSSSVREGRLSHRAALYIRRYIEDHYPATAEILDLKSYGFPLFDERLAYQKNPSEELQDFTRRLMEADGIVIVTPVYNASFPAALKNVIDLYYAEWKRKPVGIVSVTSGSVPGIATVQQLQTLLLKLGALVPPVLATAIQAAETFTEEGEGGPTAERTVRPLLGELLWLMERTESPSVQALYLHVDPENSQTMLILLSPAKTMNMEPQERRLPSSRPRYEKEAECLASEMRKFSAPQLGKLLKINDSLAQVNFERYQHFGSASNPEKQALFAYDGSVFRHIDPAGMTDDDLLYAQERLRIVSTLYGLVRPLDLIQAYRIAFTLRLGDRNGNLYDYWYPKLTEPLIETARKAGGIVINLASQDVMAALDTDRIRQQVGMIDAEFQEHRNGRYETVRTYAKMARGEMTRFILRNRIESPEGMKAFGWNGFAFDERLSSHEKIIFTREKK